MSRSETIPVKRVIKKILRKIKIINREEKKEKQTLDNGKKTL